MSPTYLMHVEKIFKVTRRLNACRKLKLVTANVTDVTLAAVLQQLPLLTVRLPAIARQPQACMHFATVVRHMHYIYYRCAALHHAVPAGNNACAVVHVNPLQTHLTGP
jgi:hypothetical protein